MLKFKKSIVLLCLLASTTIVEAGSPDGLNIVVIPNEAALPNASLVKQFWIDYKATGIRCNEEALHLENLYTTAYPPQLTSELALGAVHDNAKRKKLSKVLTQFRDKTLKHGFDAALTYELKEGQLRLYGISGFADIKVVASSLSLDDARDQKKFNAAFCKALVSFPSMTPP
jgi:hypothetical protein